MRRIECGPPHGWSAKFDDGLGHLGRLFAKGGPGKTTRLWSLSAPSDAEPLVLRRGAVVYTFGLHFIRTAVGSPPQIPGCPCGRCAGLALGHSCSLETVSYVVFGPTAVARVRVGEGVVRLTPLAGEMPETTSFVHDGSAYVRGLAASSDGKRLLVGRDYLGAAIIPLDGAPSSELGALIHADGVAFSSDGRLAAATGWEEDSEPRLHVFRTDASRK